MMIRSCSSSFRTLIHRHIRPAVAVTNLQMETPASIYNLHYLLPNSIVHRTVNLSARFSINSVGYSTSVEASRARRMSDPSKEDDFERTIDEKESEDDSELDESVFEDFDDDDDDDGDEDDDDDYYDDASRFGR